MVVRFLLKKSREAMVLASCDDGGVPFVANKLVS